MEVPCSIVVKLLNGEKVVYTNNTNLDLWNIRQYRDLLAFFSKYLDSRPTLIIRYLNDQPFDELSEPEVCQEQVYRPDDCRPLR